MARTAKEVAAVEAAGVEMSAAVDAMEACCSWPRGPGYTPVVDESRRAEYESASARARAAEAIIAADSRAHAYDLDNEVATSGCYNERLLAYDLPSLDSLSEDE